MTANDERRVRVLTRVDDPDLEAVGRAVQAALGAAPVEDDADDEGAPPIAMPEGVELPARLGEVDVAIALDPEADEAAREAGVATRVALFPRLALDWSGPLDVDLVLVAHEGLVADAVAAGASRRRVHVTGVVAPEGWEPAEDRAALREELGVDGPCAVVRAEALDPDDLAPALVQLSLVRERCAWLFDVGRDEALARSLRRRVPGYGLDARMFADGELARDAYRAADLVLGRLDGPEVARALAVGASVVCVAPRPEQARLAHRVESEGLAQIADAPATLAVTLDAALAPDALARGRAAAREAGAGEGAARVAARVRELASGELDAGAPTGLPVGLERLDAPDGPAGRPAPRPDADDDARIDAELAALREKLGL